MSPSCFTDALQCRMASASITFDSSEPFYHYGNTDIPAYVLELTTHLKTIIPGHYDY